MEMQFFGQISSLKTIDYGQQWNPGFTICQGDVKIISFKPEYRYIVLKISLYRDKGDVRLFTACYLINLHIHFSTQEAFKDIQTKETIKRQRG